MKPSVDAAILLRRFRGKGKCLKYFLAGFVDGEGSFSVAILKTEMQSFGYAINPVFQVYQHKKHRAVLELFQYVFQTGRIYRKSGTHPVLNFSIDSRRNVLERVIPFFETYPLITKFESFKIFREIVLAMERKEHHTIEGFKRLVALAYSMNQQGKGRRRTIGEIFASIDSKQIS